MSVSYAASLPSSWDRFPHVWHVDSGGHTWPVWKNDLYLISQMLFVDKK